MICSVAPRRTTLPPCRCEGCRAAHISGAVILTHGRLPVLASNSEDCVEFEPSTLRLPAIHVHVDEPEVVAPLVELVVVVIGYIIGSPCRGRTKSVVVRALDLESSLPR